MNKYRAISQTCVVGKMLNVIIASVYEHLHIDSMASPGAYHLLLFSPPEERMRQ